MNNTSSKIIGLFLIFMGIGYLGNQFDFWSFSIFYRGWWASLLVLAGICSMLENGFRIGNTVITGAGVYFFLAVNHFISFRITFQVVLAIAFIMVGIKLLFFSGKRNYFSYNNGFEEENTETRQGKKLYVHSGFTTQRVINKDVLERARVENMFGTIFLDLRDANLQDLDILSLENIFGSLEVIVPKDVNLNVRRENVFGSCYVDNTNTSDGYTVNVKETSIFGTIRITKAR